MALRSLTRAAAIAAACAFGSASAATSAPSAGSKPGKPAAAKPSAAKPSPAKAGPAKSASSGSARKAPAKPAAPALAAASPEQIEAADRVFYGTYDCEFKQSVEIEKDPQHPAYVNVKSGKTVWTMKPVLSSTGAIRLEDVKGETLMVQIASKSMLLNVKTARRIVDDCVSPRQRELIEEARLARTAAETGGGASTGAPLLQTPGAATSPAPATSPASASGTVPAAPASAASTGAAPALPASAPN